MESDRGRAGLTSARSTQGFGGLPLDAALAVASFVLFTGPVLIGWDSGHGPRWAIVVLGGLAALPLALRRRAPVAVLAAVATVLIIALLSDVRFTLFVSNGGPALALATYTVAERLPRRSAWLAAVAAILAVTTAELAVRELQLTSQEHNALQLVTALPALLLGYLVATRRRYDAQLRAREEARVREEERRIRAEERLRVSANVHDIVSSTLSMIAVRSGVARVVLEQQPEEARVALGAIESASRSALDELRAVLHALRDETVSPAVPSLADLPALVASTDLEVTLSIAPQVRAAPLVEESAYRVVQEALTNVVRHAGRVPTRVDVTCENGVLILSVVNTAGAVVPRPGGSGFGLVGMRERVGLLDGTVDAGPGPDGGFAVVARLPVGVVGTVRVDAGAPGAGSARMSDSTRGAGGR